MALNNSGPISLGGSTTGQSINLELGFAATATISLNDADVRELAGVATGAITVPTDFYGKAVSTPRAIIFGGLSPNQSNVIQYFSLESTGNASDFGDLPVPIAYMNAGSSATRAVIGAGYDQSGNPTNAMSYVTIMSTGNASDFGDFISNTYFSSTAANDTRCVFFGGDGNYNVIQYVTIATTSNTSDFGDLAVSGGTMGSCASTTRGIMFQRYNNFANNTISYITIASAGNDTDFGDGFDTDTVRAGGASNSTRGVFAGGRSYVNIIQYITIATTGNAQDFGDLTGIPFNSKLNGPAGVASSTQVVFCGGLDANLNTLNQMQYVTIASTGNGTDWGDLATATSSAAGTSNVHGGLS